MGRLTLEVGTDSAVPASEAQEGKRLLLMRNGMSATASEQPCGLAGSSMANPSAASEAQELWQRHTREEVNLRRSWVPHATCEAEIVSTGRWLTFSKAGEG